MWVCLLFALVISTNCWGSVVSFGQSSSGAATTLPANNTSTDPLNGVTLTNSGVGIGSWSTTYYMEFGNDDAYLDITLSEGYKLSSIDAGIYYDGSGEGKLNIKYATSLQYNETYKINNSETPINLSNTDFYSYPANATNIGSVPEGAKSARIYKTETRQYGIKLLRLVVTTAVDLSIKDDAELALEVTEKSIPVGGIFNLGVSIADGYDGEISYSISPAGVVSLNEGTGVVTGTAMGDATITVTASTTENYIGSTETCTVHVVKNFAGDLSAVENDGTVSLNWFYNLPISLATKGDGITHYGSYTTTYADGIRYFTYTLSNNTENKYFGACDFKTPNVPNCKSFSFEYRGENNGTNPRVVPYAWLDGAPNDGNIVANPVEIRSTWDEVTVIPSCNYYAGAANINNGAIDGLNFASYPVGCVAFFPMADGDVSEGTLQLRNAYFQLINTNGLTSSVALVRKDGSAPANASDGVVRYTGAPTTFADNSGLVAGHTYYYRVFATYNGYTYASEAISVTMPGTAKEDPELSLPASSAVLKVGDTYTLEPTVASGYDGTLAYEITAGSDKISLSGSTITAEAAGTATVRVTAPETTEYNQVTANFTVTVLAVPETNLAITNVGGDNVSLTWNIPGIIDLTTVRTKRSSDFVTDYGSSISNTTSSELLNNGAELEVTYSAAGSGSYNGFFFDVDLTSIESISFDYKGENLGEGWKGILPGIFDGSTIYWESSKGLFGLSETTWTSKTVAPSNGLWKSGTYSSGDISELCFLVYAEGDAVSNGHVYLRNLRYHSTGMTDIDHIVIRRTTSAPATSITDGDEIYSGKMSHFVDTDSKAVGLYYYTLFAVYANGCIPVESVSMDNRTFSITYKDKGDAEFSGTHETGYPTTHSNAAATALKKATKEDYIFVGWYNNAACTGDAITSLAAGAYDADITLYARWEQLSLHEPGKYQAPDGYGRVLKNVNGHDYEVYLVTYDTIEEKHYGALYAGPVTKISDGYRMFRTSSDINTSSTSLGDGWVEFKPYKYGGSEGSCNIDEFTKLNSSSSIGFSRYARLGADYYVRLYVKGYASFALIGKESEGNSFVVKINGETQTYTANTAEHVARFTLASVDEPYFIEITGDGGNNNNFRGFSLQLPDVERYTVTVAKNDNSYGTVSAASIANVRAGEATYVTDNTLYIAGTTVTATPAAATAEYTYAFDNWSGVPATITATTTITANFTRTAEEYTLTWDLNGGIVTTAGTGADVDATGTPSSLVAYGTVITAPVVEKAGCDFLGWDVTPASTMPAADVTYTAKWYAPVVIPSGTTHLDANNYYPYTTAAKAPTKSTFNVDGEGDAETCLDISNNHYAEWQAKIAQGYYQVTMLYGTTGYAVNVNLKVIDPSTNPETVICTTTTDIHSDGSGNHCCYQAKWGVDLRGIDDDPDKLYIIRVEDVYNSTGSHPQIGYVEFEPATPTTLSGTAPTYLNHNNVTTAYRITPFDIDNNGNNEMCVFIGNQNQAEWLIKINPAIYNIRVRYGRTTGTRLTLYIIDGSDHVVWNSETRPTPSGRYEVWEINGIDLSKKVNATDEYIIRIKDDYNGTGSKPYIEYIEFIPKVTYTRTGLTVGNYGTICLPYAVAAEDIHGADIFDMQGWPAGSVAVVLNEVDNMVAGRPYIFQAKATTATWSYYPEGDEAEAGSHNGLIGSYTKEEIPVNANNYMVYKNKLYYVDVLSYVGANKAYINRTLAEAAAAPVAPAPGKRQIRLFLDGEQVITDIDQINDQMTNTKYMENGILYILREGKVYNAQGQLVK